MNVPNALTVLRMCAVPVFIWLFLRGHEGAALAVFIGAMITDALDGILARALKQFTKLGAILDPLADKAMGVAALLVLCYARRLPWWLLGLMVFREVCIFTAIWVLDRTGRSYQIRPTRSGKYSTAFLTATIIFALAHGATGGWLSEPFVAALTLVSAECIVVSWAQYLWMWIVLMRAQPVRPA